MGPWSRAIGVVALVACACGGGESARTNGAGTNGGGREQGTGEERTGTTPPADLRALGLVATFAELVAAASTLDDRGEIDSAAGCILRGEGPYRLEADLAAAVRPLPAPPEELDARLERTTGAIRVFTRWGQVGEGEALVLVAFTTAPPPDDRPLLAAVLTDRGVYLRSTASAMNADPVAISGAGARIARVADETGASAVLVTAEGGMSLASLRALLAAMPHSTPVVLASPLEEGTRLPPPRAAPATPTNGAAVCEALPEQPEGTRQGDLDPSAALAALSPLRDAAQQCMSASRAAANGGRLVLLLRAGTDGRVTDACVTNDTADDPALRQCVVDAARAIALPRPTPDGTADLALPLVFDPDPTLRQRPLCD